jgi:general secretion pathway protein G
MNRPPFFSGKRFHRRSTTGFTVLEMIIVIAVIAILAAMITPLAVNQINQKRFDAARDELAEIKKAIVGSSDLVSGGTRNSYGFAGDLGLVPLRAPNGNGLLELLSQGALPSWQQSSGVWWGWRGPYLSDVRDPWGRDYDYADYWSGGAPAGSYLLARVWSYGPDGVNDSGVTGTSPSGDDLYIDIRYDEVFSRVTGNTVDSCGASAAFTDITLFYPRRTGVFSTTFSTTVANPIFNPAEVFPIGVRLIAVSNPAMQQQFYVANGPLTVVNLRTPGVCN